MPEVLTKKERFTDEEAPYYLVTTGIGRQGKAHVPTEDEEALCGYGGSRMKRVDTEVVEKFHQKCSKCQNKTEK